MSPLSLFGSLLGACGWFAAHRAAAGTITALVGLGLHIALRFGFGASEWVSNLPLWLTFLFAGVPLLAALALSAWRGEFGADWLAGVSLVTALALGQYVAGVLVILMLSGGQTLEAFAIASASHVLSALAKRAPLSAHRRIEERLEDVPLDHIRVGDIVAIGPHEICPVDGVVVEGRGSMDESFLTGEPYNMSKTPGTQVLSGSVNGDSVLIVRASKLPVDSRYAQIVRVLEQGERFRPRMRRLGDQLGGWYAPFALVVAGAAWLWSGDPLRFLAVLVIATPCPLLIGIPVAIVGAISLAARHGIIVKKPAILEQIGACRTIIFDKTGTLTYGRPMLTEQITAAGWNPRDVLRFVAGVERYSKHPLAGAVSDAIAREGIAAAEATQIQEPPGEGLRGLVEGRRVTVTGRGKLLALRPELASVLPPIEPGLECLVLIDDAYVAAYRFRDEARSDGRTFIQHLGPRHGIRRVLLVSGDREAEVRYLAAQVGIDELRAEQSPEEKVEVVRAENAICPTMFVGDGINDAPALQAAAVGIGFGHASDITSESAGAVIMDSSLKKVDMLLHIGGRMRSIALQSALGGIALSIIGMAFGAAGMLTPVAGAIAQELIDVVAVLNALRVAWPRRDLTDY